MGRRSYEELQFIPYTIAEFVCWNPPHAEHPNNKSRRLKFIKSRKRIKEFAERVDQKCKFAWDNQALWFTQLVRKRGNKGRDQLTWLIYNWLVQELLPN